MALMYVVNQDLVLPTALDTESIADTQGGASATPETGATAQATTPGFTPIGMGKPLSVEIVTIYVGNHMSTWLDKDKNVLLVSGVKTLQTFNAVSMAMNFTKKNVKDFEYPEFEAMSDGVPIVYYTQALDTESLIITFEFIADNFNQSIFDDISKLFTAAAGIPVFLPAEGYLLAGSEIVKIAGELGNTLFQKPPFLNDTISLKFNSPLFPIPVSQMMIVCNDSDLAELQTCKITVSGGTDGIKATANLITADGKKYAGNAPYLIISLDGRDRKQDLGQFTPTLATSAILQQFYGSGDVAGTVTTTLQEALSLYNDATYNKKALALKAAMSGLTQDSDEYKKDKTLFDAYNTNIQNDAFKVAFP